MKETSKFYGTKEDRISLIAFVHYCCKKNVPIIENWLAKVYNTTHPIRKLLEEGVIIETPNKNIYAWGDPGSSPEDYIRIAGSCWVRNAKEKTNSIRKNEPAKNLSIGEISFTDTSDLIIPEALFPKSYFMEKLREAITMAASYGVTNYGAYILHYMDEKFKSWNEGPK